MVSQLVTVLNNNSFHSSRLVSSDFGEMANPTGEPAFPYFIHIAVTTVSRYLQIVNETRRARRFLTSGGISSIIVQRFFQYMLIHKHLSSTHVHLEVRASITHGDVAVVRTHRNHTYVIAVHFDIIDFYSSLLRIQ